MIITLAPGDGDKQVSGAHCPDSLTNLVFQAWDPVSKNKVCVTWRMTPKLVLWPPHRPPNMFTCTHAHTSPFPHAAVHLCSNPRLCIMWHLVPYSIQHPLPEPYSPPESPCAWVTDAHLQLLQTVPGWPCLPPSNLWCRTLYPSGMSIHCSL